MDLIKKYLSEEQKDSGWKPAQSSRKDKYGNPIKTSNVARSLARQAMQSAVKDLKKGPEAGKRQVEEVEELDELDDPTVQKYITRAKFSTNPKRRAMAQKAQSKLQQKPKTMETEAVEDRILDKGHSPERLQKTIDKAREHEKSYFKKRADAFSKPTDYDSRYKEDQRLKRVRKVMSAASAAKRYASGDTTKPFTGRIGRTQ